jgi:hypothetical protein
MEETSIFCDEKEQGADCADAGTERLEADIEGRIGADATCIVDAWHSNFDNKSCEWKSRFTIADYKLRCKRKKRPHDTLSWGEVNRGKCGADSTGARHGNRLKRTRRDPSLPTPETAKEIETVSTDWGHVLMSARKFGPARDAKAKISRSAMLGIDRADLDAAKARRGANIVVLANVKQVRQVFYRADTDQVGTRFFRCVCAPCFQRNFSQCVAKAWTLGEPVWQ